MDKSFQLDRTAFATLSFKEADKEMSQFHDYAWKDRLLIAKQLIAIAYNFSVNNPPRMDKTFFEIHQHNG